MAVNEWRNHKSGVPCPICNKARRCQYTNDGAYRCFRIVEPPVGWRVITTCADGTKVFRRDGDTTQPRRPTQDRFQVAEEPAQPLRDWQAESIRFTAALTPESVADLAQKLGVRIEALHAIRCGWADHNDVRRLGAHGAGWSAGAR